MKKKPGLEAVEYFFDPVSRLPQELAPSVGKHLHQLREQHHSLTRETVVEDAKQPDSPLHGFFNWDDKSAAVEHRLEQAGHLLRSIKIRYVDLSSGANREVRAFIPIRRGGLPAEEDLPELAAKTTYMPIFQAMNDETLREQVIQRALAEANAWMQRYEHLKEFATIVTAIKKTKRSFKRRHVRKRRKSA